MKIPMGDNEKYKVDLVFEEKKPKTPKLKETTKCEEKEIFDRDKVDSKGEKGFQDTLLIIKSLPKGDEKGVLKSKRTNRASMMRRSLSEVNFSFFYISCGPT